MSTEWQLRIVDGDGQKLRGAAVVVSPTHAITCAHVVYNAVLAAGGTDPGPGSTVYLRRPGHAEPVLTGTVVEGGWWWKDRTPWDVAVLRMEPAPDVSPAVLARVGPFRPRSERVSVSGFPGAEFGQWVLARLRRRGGPRREYFQFDVELGSSLQIQRGFSGGGVIEEHSGSVLGIVCDASASGRVGWMIPTEEIPPVWEPRSTPPGPDPADQTDLIHQLSLAVAELDTIASPDARRVFHRSLEPRLRRRIAANQSDQLYAEELVSRAHRGFGVLRPVLEQLDRREEGAVAMGEVWSVARRLLGEEE